MKIERVNSELKRQIQYVIDGEVKDPRIGGMITVTGVKTTPDLKYAKVSLSIFGDDEVEKKEAFDAICKASGFIRSTVKDLVRLRYMPELHFVLDRSIEHSLKINEILKSLNAEHSGQGNGDSNDN
ncbi:MAG: 30S ribosome-binding factor RbfA [Clostridiales bacterium]|nr:30S ribosome-binding factor RbfA [Clostridiales bacterium]